MLALLRSLDQAVFYVCRWGVILGIVGLFLLLGANVLTRMLPFVSLVGYDEVVELIFAWVVFLGVVALWREGGLYRVAIIAATAPHSLRRAVELLIALLMLLVALVLTFKGAEFMLYSGERTPLLRLDKSFWYASVPVCGALMTIYSLVGLVRLARGEEDGPEAATDNLG